MTDHPIIQAVVDRAYARWQVNKEWNKQAFWDQLDADERIAVFVGNMNYQIHNGGFAQWYGNRYATPETIGFIERLCSRIATQTSLEVLDLVTRSRSVGIFDRDWDDVDAEDELGQLDTRYYAVADAFMTDVERHLTEVMVLRRTT